MRAHCLIPLAAAMANLVIGTLVLRRGMHDRVHRVFAWAALTLTSWNLAIFSLYYFSSAEAAEWWSRIFRIGICFAPVATFHLTSLLVGSTARGWALLVAAGYVASAGLVALDLSGALVARVSPHTWGWYIEPTRLYSLMTALIVIYLPLCVVQTWRAYRNPTSARHRVQAKFWLLACAVQTPLTLTNLLPAYGINIYPLGNVGNVLFTGIVAYAMVRHRLMDVDYIVRKGVSFVVASAVVLIPGGIALMALCRAFAINEPLIFVCAALAFALLAVILVPTIQEALETRVHRALFRSQYDSRRRLRELAADLVHLLDQAELVRRLGAGLTEILDVEACEIFVRDEATRRLMLEAAAPATEAALPDTLAAAVERLTEPVLAGELEATHPEAGPLSRARGWEVAIPLRINERLIGLIALGRNRDFRLFSAEDLQLLAALASATTVALENSRLSRQLRRSEAVLERANRLSSLGTLAGGIAHEIRNPLVAVKTFLDLLPERLDDKEFLVNFRNLSLSELRRVTDLITDLLSLGKTTTGGRRMVALKETLEPVVRLMESTAHKREIALVEELDPGLLSVWADPDQVKLIALNLILNAIEVSPAGARVRLVVRRGTEPAAAPVVVLEVHDEGPGIPREQLEDIFLPFFTTKDTGTGLGLAMVHQMVVEHGGQITVDSVVGRGTIFRVTLPAARLELAGTGT